MRIVQNVLDQGLLARVEEYFSTAGWRYGWRSASGEETARHWHHALTDPDYAQNGLTVLPNLPPLFQEVWDQVSRTALPKHVPVRAYANAHTYGTEGYPHRDTSRVGLTTMVLYLNRTWKPTWGGETTLHLPDGRLVSSPVRFNHGFLFDSYTEHVARGVSRICPELRVTLVFKAAPIDLDPDRDRLQRFLERKRIPKYPHRSRTLLDHLLRTYDLLKRAGGPPYLCLAGGAHSVFGTQVYRHKALAATDAAELKEVIGPEALELVQAFAKMRRPKALEDALAAQGVTGLDRKMRALCSIEAANLLEQGSLGRYPKLSAMWEKHSK